MQTDRAACGMIGLIAALAQKMNLKAIAAGIESARQVERLLELKCEYGQGYCFSQSRDAKTALQFSGQHVAPTRTLEAAK